MAKTITERLVESTRFIKDDNLTARKIKSLMKEASVEIKYLKDELKDYQEDFHLISQTGLDDKDKVLEVLRRQTEAITEMKELSKVLAEKRERTERSNPVVKYARKLAHKFLSAKTPEDKLNVNAGLSLLAVAGNLDTSDQRQLVNLAIKVARLEGE